MCRLEGKDIIILEGFIMCDVGLLKAFYLKVVKKATVAVWLQVNFFDSTFLIAPGYHTVLSYCTIVLYSPGLYCVSVYCTKWYTFRSFGIDKENNDVGLNLRL